MKRFVPLCLCAFVTFLLAYPHIADAEISIAAGASHTALVKDNTVWTWGKNEYGQMGDGTQIDSPVPVRIRTISNALSAKGGSAHTLVLNNDKTVRSFGYNGSGQLGVGTDDDSNTPIEISEFTNNNYMITQIAAGQYHSAALQDTGTVWTWGYNFYGQLGHGSKTDKNKPYSIGGIQAVAAIAAGNNHTLAVLNDADSKLLAWGYNSRGQIGDGTITDRLFPVTVKADAGTDFNNVRRITAGQYHSAALKFNGTVWSWGDNSKGQLGDNSNTQRLYPVPASGLDNVEAIASGLNHTLALRSDKTVWAWGDNSKGQLGDHSTTQRKTPVQIPNFNAVIAIAAGGNHSMAVKEDGSVWAWGDNTYGQLGCKTSTSYSSVPMQVMVPGDLNADWQIDLTDVILSLRITDNITPEIVYLSDVNGDGKIGLEESSYILQIIAEIR